MSARERLLEQAAQRILITDGAFGTEIQNWQLTEADYMGDLALAKDAKGNNDILALTKPEVLDSITRAYLSAGSDIVSTNTFSANRISQADYAAEHLVREINLASAHIAGAAADEFAARDGRPRFVAGALGPTNKTLSLSPDVNDPGYREIDFDYLKDVYREQVDALVEGGVDFILIETVFDTLNAQGGDHGGVGERSYSDDDLDDADRSVGPQPVGPYGGGVLARRASRQAADDRLNCSFGAEQLRPHVKVLSALADTLIMVYPNAGLPNDLGEYDELPAQTAALVREWAEAGQVNILGGCCGSTPAHIAAMAKAVVGFLRARCPSHRSLCASPG